MSNEQYYSDNSCTQCGHFVFEHPDDTPPFSHACAVFGLDGLLTHYNIHYLSDLNRVPSLPLATNSNSGTTQTTTQTTSTDPLLSSPLLVVAEQLDGLHALLLASEMLVD